VEFVNASRRLSELGGSNLTQRRQDAEIGERAAERFVCAALRRGASDSAYGFGVAGAGAPVLRVTPDTVAVSTAAGSCALTANPR
jgi:hypothetical protein